MRHLKSGRKLNRTASHRKAMLGNLAMSILRHERVTTTVSKAKEVRSVVERLITYGKKGDIHGRRLAARRINDRVVLKKLFDDIAPAYESREGGYTRILRVGERRGDNAELAIIELVGRNGDEQRKRKKKRKSVRKRVQPSAKSIARETGEVVPAEAAAKAGGEPVSAAEDGPEMTALEKGAKETKAAKTDTGEKKPASSRKTKDMPEKKPAGKTAKKAPAKKASDGGVKTTRKKAATPRKKGVDLKGKAEK